MESSPDISIVIPMRNNENELAICLDSILFQESSLVLECVVIDDDSTDASLALARSYAERFPQLRVLSQPHAGAGAARNRGIVEARGRYLWFVDADDYITPDALREIQASIRNTDNDIDIFLFARVKCFLGENRVEPMPRRLQKIFFAPRIEGRVINIARHHAIASMIFWPLHNLIWRRDFVNENSLRCSETMVMNDMFMAFSGICCARKLVTRNKVIYAYCRRDSIKPDHVSLIDDDRRLACMTVLDSCDRLVKEKNLPPEVVHNYHISKAALLDWTLKAITPPLRPAIETYARTFLNSLPPKQLLRLFREMPVHYLGSINKYFISGVLRTIFPGASLLGPLFAALPPGIARTLVTRLGKACGAFPTSAPEQKSAPYAKKPDYYERGERKLKNLNNELLKYTGREIKPGQSILDFGAGAGSFLAACLRAGLDAYGIDCSSIQKTRYVREAAAPQLAERFLLYDGGILPFASGTFEYVYSWFVIEHIEDLFTSCKEIVRVLKPGGVCVLYSQDARNSYEGHAKIPWPPFLPKQFIRPYLEEWKKGESGLENINYLIDYLNSSVFYITTPQVLSILQYFGLTILYSSDPQDTWCKESYHIRTDDDARKTAWKLMKSRRDQVWQMPSENMRIFARKN